MSEEERIFAKLERHSVVIVYIDQARHIYDVAGGVLGELDGKHFLVTAAHCVELDQEPGEEFALLYGQSDGKLRPLRDRDYLIDRGHVRSGWRDCSPPLDIGYFKVLNPNTLVQAGKCFVDLASEVFSPEDWESDQPLQIFTVGTPFAFVDTRSSDIKLFDILRLDSQFSWQGAVDFRFLYGSGYVECSVTGKPIPAPGGLSGYGVWIVDPKGQPRLAGITSGYDRSSQTSGQPNEMRAIKIDQLGFPPSF